MRAIESQITSVSIVYSRLRSIKTSKLRVTGLCAGISPVTDEFPPHTKGQLCGKCFHLMASSCVGGAKIGIDHVYNVHSTSRWQFQMYDHLVAKIATAQLFVLYINHVLWEPTLLRPFYVRIHVSSQQCSNRASDWPVLYFQPIESQVWNFNFNFNCNYIYRNI